MPDPVVPTVLTLTEQERRVIHSALILASGMLDLEGKPESATTALEVAYRVLPGGLRGLENAA